MNRVHLCFILISELSSINCFQVFFLYHFARFIFLKFPPISTIFTFSEKVISFPNSRIFWNFTQLILIKQSCIRWSLEQFYKEILKVNFMLNRVSKRRKPKLPIKSRLMRNIEFRSKGQIMTRLVVELNRFPGYLIIWNFKNQLRSASNTSHSSEQPIWICKMVFLEKRRCGVDEILV